MPYFLSAWQPNRLNINESYESWNFLRGRALVFDGPSARQIANQLNAQNPTTSLLAIVKALR